MLHGTAEVSQSLRCLSTSCVWRPLIYLICRTPIPTESCSTETATIEIPHFGVPLVCSIIRSTNTEMLLMPTLVLLGSIPIFPKCGMIWERSTSHAIKSTTPWTPTRELQSSIQPTSTSSRGSARSGRSCQGMETRRTFPLPLPQIISALLNVVAHFQEGKNVASNTQRSRCHARPNWKQAG